LPLYEYRCLKCDRHTDKIEKMNGPHLKKCPHCGGKVESVITAPCYVNEYGPKTTGDAAGKSEKGEKSEKSEKPEKSEKSEKSDSKSTTTSTKDQKKTGSASKEK
jgi:putative FmdB family regulatory protein